MSKAQVSMADLMCKTAGCYGYTIKDGISLCKRCYQKVHGCLPCMEKGCKKQAQREGYCRKHGHKHGIVPYEPSRCKEEGCKKQAQNGGFCVKHGRQRGLYPPAKKRGRKKKNS